MSCRAEEQCPQYDSLLYPPDFLNRRIPPPRLRDRDQPNGSALRAIRTRSYGSCPSTGSRSWFRRLKRQEILIEPFGRAMIDGIAFRLELPRQPSAPLGRHMEAARRLGDPSLRQRFEDLADRFRRTRERGCKTFDRCKTEQRQRPR